MRYRLVKYSGIYKLPDGRWGIVGVRKTDFIIEIDENTTKEDIYNILKKEGILDSYVSSIEEVEIDDLKNKYIDIHLKDGLYPVCRFEKDNRIKSSPSKIQIVDEYPDMMSHPVAMEERDKYIFLNGYETAIQDMLDYLSVLKSWKQQDTVKVQELLEWLRRENKKKCYQEK